VPPVFVDRAGAKVALLQQQSRNSRSSVGAVLEQVPAPTRLPPLAAQLRAWPSALGATTIGRPMLDGLSAGLIGAAKPLISLQLSRMGCRSLCCSHL